MEIVNRNYDFGVPSVGGRSVTRLLHKRRRNENALAFVEKVFGGFDADGGNAHQFHPRELLLY